MSTPVAARRVAGFNPAAVGLSMCESRRTRSVVGGLLESVWKNSLDGMRITDENGIIALVNDAYCRLVAMDASELEGQPFTASFCPSSLSPDVVEKYQQRFRQRSTEVHVEGEVVLRSRKIVYLEVTNSYVKSSDGKELLLSIFRDVTERKVAEQALQESEKKYHELFEHAVQGMFQSTVDGRLIAANPALLRMLGYASLQELADVDLAEALYVNPEDRRSLSKTLEEQGLCSGVELQLKRKDGRAITVLEHSRAVRDEEGDVLRYEGIIEDITARKGLEARVREHLEALKASRESLAGLNAQKDKLFSILSHDLRSPFGSILGFCEILLDENQEVTEAEQREFLSYIRNSAQQQLELVNRLLDWSRLETGRIRMEIRDLDLRTVVQSSINSLLGLAAQKDILLYTNLPSGLVVRGDGTLLAQVFSNLVANALKFTPAKGVIAVELAGRNDDSITITVTDTGAGIPREDLNRLFKVEEKYTRPGLNGEQGTGLGLPVVYEIMQKHSGTIDVESEVGKGTTFKLQFPRVLSGDQRHVLIVDDEHGVRVLHTRYLKSALPEASPVYASNGKEAFECAKKYRPQLIITDYAMPEMDGFEFLDLLKHDTSTKDIPVFVVTGEDSTASREALLLSGAVEVLVKPIVQESFENAIKKAMAR
jgi:PAS domain S-box-containing protein